MSDNFTFNPVFLPKCFNTNNIITASLHDISHYLSVQFSLSMNPPKIKLEQKGLGCWNSIPFDSCPRHDFWSFDKELRQLENEWKIIPTSLWKKYDRKKKPPLLFICVWFVDTDHGIILSHIKRNYSHKYNSKILCHLLYRINIINHNLNFLLLVCWISLLLERADTMSRQQCLRLFPPMTAKFVSSHLLTKIYHTLFSKHSLKESSIWALPQKNTVHPTSNMNEIMLNSWNLCGNCDHFWELIAWRSK